MLQQQPQWQPIGMLPTLARHIDGLLAADREQYKTLLEAKPKPYVLDGATVSLIISAFTTQKNDFWLFEEQLRQWQAGTLSDGQRRELTCLVEQMWLLHETNMQVLDLAKELQQGPIEKQMAKLNEQLGFEQIMRMLGGEGKQQ